MQSIGDLLWGCKVEKWSCRRFRRFDFGVNVTEFHVSQKMPKNSEFELAPPKMTQVQGKVGRDIPFLPGRVRRLGWLDPTSDTDRRTINCAMVSRLCWPVSEESGGEEAAAFNNVRQGLRFSSRLDLWQASQALPSS